MKKGRLLIIAGPSGIGKKTLLKEILQDKSLKIEFSISFTTRTPRPQEINGVDYFFITKEEFKEKIKNNLMLEYAEFFNNYYGTSKEWVEEKLNQGTNVLLEIETEGFQQIKAKFPDLVSIFILPTSLTELERRLRIRGTETDEEIAIRMQKASTEISDAHLFKYQIVNDEIKKATEELIQILKSEL